MDGGHDLHRADRWVAANWPIPCRASCSMADSSASVNVASSPVPCTSTKRPPPVITTFMSTAAAESSW